MPTVLTRDQLDDWRREGLFVLPGFASATAIDALKQRAGEIVEAFEPSADRAVFSSRDRSRLSQRALAASADRVQCFFEEEAFDTSGCLVVDKARAINKIGHALHDRDAVFDRFSRDPRLAAIAADLGQGTSGVLAGPGPQPSIPLGSTALSHEPPGRRG